MNYRDLRWAIFPLINSVIVFCILKLNIYLMGAYKYSTIGINSLYIAFNACIVILLIVLVIQIPYNLLKVIKYRKTLNNKDREYCNWKYSKKVWRRFINYNYKKKSGVEIKIIFKKSMWIFVSISVSAIVVLVQKNVDNQLRYTFILFMYLGFLILYIIPKTLKIIISWIDNLIFTNCNIILATSYIIINNEMLIFNCKGKNGIIKKGIYNGNIEIYYSTEWNYSKITGFTSLKRDNINKLIIPIPKNEYDNAKKYINAQFLKF